jgi:uncharacterized membrane protein
MSESPVARYFDKGRVEAYTDAVFAIAATLLVLDLTTTTIGKVSSDAQLWAGLQAMWPNFISFAVSFALLSLLWMIHLQQFRDVARADTTLIWLNNARLLFVVLIPFTTSLVSDYSAYYAGRMMLPINFFLAALFGYLSWAWAAARKGHLLTEESAGERIYQGAGGIAAVICGAVAMVASPWLGSAGFFAYAFNGLLAGAIRRRRTRKAAQTAR